MKKFSEFINEAKRGGEPTRKPTFKLTTKNKLVKLLKDDGNFNLKFVESLDYDSDLVYSVGNYEEMQYNTTEKAYGKFIEKARALLASVEDMFDEKMEKTLKAANIKDELTRIERSKYGKDTEAVKKLFVELAKDMTSTEVQQHPTDKIRYKIDGDESISVGGRTSTWSFYITGSTKTEDKVFKAKDVHVSSETNRL